MDDRLEREHSATAFQRVVEVRPNAQIAAVAAHAGDLLLEQAEQMGLAAPHGPLVGIHLIRDMRVPASDAGRWWLAPCPGSRTGDADRTGPAAELE